jgi:hypothetical protein
MTAKEKANELFDKILKSNDYEGYCPGCGLVEEQARDIAIIAVDEIIKTLYVIEKSHEAVSARYYWIDVKKELEKDSIFLKS